jgi:hypothetical protein
VSKQLIWQGKRQDEAGRITLVACCALPGLSKLVAETSPQPAWAWMWREISFSGAEEFSTCIVFLGWLWDCHRRFPMSVLLVVRSRRLPATSQRKLGALLCWNQIPYLVHFLQFRFSDLWTEITRCFLFLEYEEEKVHAQWWSLRRFGNRFAV